MTQLTLYNTLTRSKEPFTPIDPNNVRMYVCGPTVYDHAHIGNARPVIVFDVLFRLLRHIYGEDAVKYVRNITDVDDKIIDRARRDFPDLDLNAAIAKVTESTTAQFQADMKALGCLEPTVEPKATEHIGGMVEMISTLIAKGNAYVASGAKGREVLFDVTSDDDYGVLSNRKLDDQQAGARVAVESHKRNPGDFVLWKESAADEPGWDGGFTSSSGGETIHGRPGWHIECSAMSKAHLGETFDIHGGGLDLIFPHHENEIAQSCCANSTDRMANVWMHNGYLQVEGKKMSKSDGNFITVHDLLHTEKVGGRKWPGEVVRLAILMTHYREPLDFTVRRLEEADDILIKLNRIFDSLMTSTFAKAISRPPERAGTNSAYRTANRTILSLVEDLNFKAVLDFLIRELRVSYHNLSEEKQSDWLDALARIFLMLGIKPAPQQTRNDVRDSQIAYAVRSRAEAIASKNWPVADRIRDELLAQGIQLKDGKDPETGERTTTWEVVR
ncbi:cysteine--tRNA ligase [Ahrensia sp. R2A130]|uniref:cysteine--tRNA ligase n=1 Tax=Ahrensia sp. R2A130 TaxID=744979 RepID=UPI0001E0A435|nr:cysteine--tRNA ligase [Ahrensia sp. R2A130]EFL90637.1 cysteinyl-tRNA synthetase [Ahrensia sp. R2A130]